MNLCYWRDRTKRLSKRKNRLLIGIIFFVAYVFSKSAVNMNLLLLSCCSIHVSNYFHFDGCSWNDLAIDVSLHISKQRNEIFLDEETPASKKEKILFLPVFLKEMTIIFGKGLAKFWELWEIKKFHFRFQPFIPTEKCENSKIADEIKENTDGTLIERK